MLANEQAVKDGLRQAFEIYLSEADLSKAIGENGRLHAWVDLHVERGRVRWTKGAAYFERRIDTGGR